MRGRIAIGLSVFLVAGLFILLMAAPEDNDQSMETIAKNMINNQEEVMKTTVSRVDLDLRYNNFSGLEELVSEDELNFLKLEMRRLFVGYYPEVSALKTAAVSYYEKNEEQVLENTGIETLESFMLLYQKLAHIPDYDLVELVLDESSIFSDASYTHFQMTAIYDGIIEVDYFVSLNRQKSTLSID